VPVLDPRFSYRAEDVVRALEQVCPIVGCPKTIRVDQGSEFISRDVDLWADAKGVMNRPGFAGGSNFQIGWSHDEQNDEQVFP
jgi:putative transposase